MARFRTKTISRRTVEALKVEKDTVFWDRELPGFGVRVYPSGRKVYIAQARAKGKAAQRVTVAPHGVISPEEARRRAALIVSRIKAGEEPVPEPLSAMLAKGPTVADIARRYEPNARQSGGWWRIPCPAHGGTDNNLAIKDGDQGGLRLRCHSQRCSYNAILRAFQDDGLVINRHWTYPSGKS